jgi:hypothetical protein
MNYLIWSEDHGGWRGPGEETGYVSVISAAGRYTLEQARVIYEQNSHHAVMVLAPESIKEMDDMLTFLNNEHAALTRCLTGDVR